MGKSISDIVYDYCKQIDKHWGQWDTAHEIYEKGMVKLQNAYNNNEIDYATFEHLQDVLTHTN